MSYTSSDLTIKKTFIVSPIASEVDAPAGSLKIEQATDLSLLDMSDLNAGFEFNGSYAAAFKIVAPDGSVVYKNAKYDTFAGYYILSYLTDPPNNALSDLYKVEGGASNNAFDKALVLNAAGKILSGIYTVYMKFAIEIIDTVELTCSYQIVTDTFTYTFDYESISADLSLEFDCEASKATATDETDYPDGTLTRNLKLYYPNGLIPAKSPLTTSTNQIVVSPIFSKTWTVTVYSEYIGSYADNWYIMDVITGSKEAEADCDINVCEIYCGIKKLRQRYENMSGKNFQKAEELLMQLTLVLMYLQLFYLARRCGKPDDMNGYLTKMKEIGEFTSDCCSENDTPVEIVSVGGGSGSAVVIGGDAITVTDEVAGVNTEYTVSLSSAYKAKIDALHNAIVALGASSGMTLTTTTDVDGNITYTLIVAAGGITAAKLATDAVETIKIKNSAVTVAKTSIGQRDEVHYAYISFDEGSMGSFGYPLPNKRTIWKIIAHVAQTIGGGGNGQLSFQVGGQNINNVAGPHITLNDGSVPGMQALILVGSNNEPDQTDELVIAASKTGIATGAAHLFIFMTKTDEQ